MVAVKNEGIILEKTNLEFENKGVFNPACIQVSDITHMFYQAVSHNDISSIRDRRLYIYYGAADKLIAAKSVNLTELLTKLKENPLKL